MAIHVRRQLLLVGVVLLLQLCAESEARPKVIPGRSNWILLIYPTYLKQDTNADDNGDGDDDDSSSEETVEDSDEAGRRRRDVSANNSAGGGRAGIPGLPDPATIIKIAELFQSVGEQIVPILLEAVLPGADATGDRIAR
ncbi:hypothetical protein KR222_006290, partial [Zaprionus bogoriensis]